MIQKADADIIRESLEALVNLFPQRGDGDEGSQNKARKRVRATL